MARYFIGFLLAIGLIILVIILLFSGGGKPQVPSTTKVLSSFSSTDATTSMTIDGPVNDPQNHEQIKIIVSNSDITFEHLKGYDGHVVSVRTYPNTEKSYYVFLRALMGAKFTNGDTSQSLADSTGYCPLGNRYIFNLSQEGQTIEQFWTTNCSGPKTYHGDSNLTVTLFEDQVPNYDDLVANIQLQ
ncbi:MAG TPA: hypothetical protein VG992_04070 [Candidatus Saccharimonadales bacterium]|nr:hypothetical protein [Candidatus Saccharimonadales bacterium]